jgi:hypothetical protein
MSDRMRSRTCTARVLFEGPLFMVRAYHGSRFSGKVSKIS